MACYTSNCEVANITMSLRCFVIVILFLKTISCDNVNPKANTTYIKKLVDIMNNPLGNRKQLNHKTGRYLNEYDVVTNDGYILKIFRLTYKNNKVPSDKYPVLIVHGLFQSSDRFLHQSESQSLAFKLQDFRYDVWLANVRGNKYGRRHTSFGPETKYKANFFNYTYEEIGLKDVSATVDFILDETKHEKIHYIGYSLGGTSFLVLNSMEPKFNDKFETAHLMAPVGYQNYFPNSNLTVEANRIAEIYEKLLNVSTVEIFPYEPSNKDKRFSSEECLGDKTYQNICNLLKIYETMGLKSQGNNINETRGGSIKQLVHLAQNIKSKNFSRWDYGEEENKDRYGAKLPPKYNLDLITVVTTIIYAQNDEYVSPKDIAKMASDLVNATTREVRRIDFKHKDFIDAPDVMELVYDNIIRDLEKNSNYDNLIARQNVIKLKNDMNNNTNQVTELTDEDEVVTVKEINWAWSVVVPCCLVIAVTVFICVVRSIDLSCYTEL